ncbi:unnamed protein product [Diabrotica balteata]|uniref:Uncharacterized protein n=1 Tax=Diabrotica balteata TaxID=107213 RepID=A0A9N9XIU5_DIABA|nr:unnamed protein product [Diabrotica balteata]
MDGPSSQNKYHIMVRFPGAFVYIFYDIMKERKIKTESLQKFIKLYKEYKTLESPRDQKKICEYNDDEDVVDFEKLYACLLTLSGSCHQGLVIDELEKYLSKPRAASSKDILK